jgi:hypothetical protein
MFEENKCLLTRVTCYLLELQISVCKTLCCKHSRLYVVSTQHRGKGATDRTARKFVLGCLEKFVNEPELKYVLDAIKG